MPAARQQHSTRDCSRKNRKRNTSIHIPPEKFKPSSLKESGCDKQVTVTNIAIPLDLFLRVSFSAFFIHMIQKKVIRYRSIMVYNKFTTSIDFEKTLCYNS